jgi:hypothetical protein
MKMRCSCRLLAGAAALVAIAGCTEPVGSVSGEVRYKGAPLPYGQITVFRADGRSASSVIEDGAFEIHKAPVGEVKVTVQSLSAPGARTMLFRPDGSKDDDDPPTPNDARGQKPVRIPDRYKDPAKSGLSFTIHAGAQTHDVDLQP